MDLPPPPPPGSAYRPGPGAPEPAPHPRAPGLRGLHLGDFVLGAPAGRGGFGTVHAGEQRTTGRKVALKLLHPGLPTEVLARFQREAAFLARFNHPHIAAIIGFFEAVPALGAAPELAREEWASELLHGGRPRAFIAMEWIAGPTLETVFRDAADPAKRPDHATLTRWFAEAAEALAAVHAAGLVHRDVKPGNLMLTEGGTLKLTDFGIARPQEAERTLVTAAGALFGTLAYMSPEQLRSAQAGAEVGPASDIYSLGATFYELFSGRRLLDHDRTGAEAVCALKLSAARPARAPLHARRLPWELETLLMGCLEPEPADRPRSMGELAEDLRRFGDSEPIRYRRPSLPRRLRLGWRRNRREASLTLVFATVLLLLAAWWWRRPGTLELDLKPVGATLEVGGRTYPVGEAPLQLRLPSGARTLKLSAPDHLAETRELLVPRGGTRALAVHLRHAQGMVDASAHPAGAELLLDGRNHGSRLAGHPLDTGRHRLEARAPDHFDAVADFDLGADQNLRRRFSLDRGMLWRQQDSGLQGGLIAVPDADGDGQEDFLHNHLDAVVLFSSDGGSVLGGWRLPYQNRRSFAAFDLGGIRVAVSGLDASGLAGCGDELVIWDQARPKAGPIWRWSADEPGPVPDDHLPASVRLGAADDLDGDGRRELAVGTHGRMYLLDTAAKQARLLEPEGGLRLEFPAPLGCAGAPQARALVYQGTRAGRPVIGALALADGRRLWGLELGAGASVQALDSATDLLVGDGTELRRLDGASGRVRWSVSLPQTPAGPPLRAGELLLVRTTDPEHPLLAFDTADGKLRWRGTVAAEAGQPTDAEGALLTTADGSLLLAAPKRLLLLDPANGAVRRLLPGDCLGGLRTDMDDDGKPELLLGLRGIGLVCLGADGKTDWTLRLEDELRPALALRGPGAPRILLHRHAAQLALARGPLLAWSDQAQGPLEAPPLVCGTGADLRVLQSGPYGAAGALVAYGADGARRWTCPDNFAPNQPPALADLDGDGKVELVALGRVQGGGEDGVRIYATDDGRLLHHFPLPGHSWMGGPPALADVNADGRPDILLARYDTHDVLALDGRDGKVLWRHDHPSAFFGPLAAGLLGGRMRVAAVDSQGLLLVLNAADGSLAFTAAFRADPRRLPAFAPAGSGHEALAVADQDGAVHALDGLGRPLAQLRAPGASGASGAPLWLGGADRLRLLAPMGGAGLAAFDWPQATLAWQAGAGVQTFAAPAPDPQDGSLWSVNGRGHLLNIHAGSGQVRRVIRTPAGSITATPVVADLDGDGRPEILLADRSGKLTVVDGARLPPAK